MKILGIINNIPYKGAENKVLRTMERDGVKRFATIEDFFIKDNPVEILPEEKELELMNYMYELQEKRTREEFEAIEMAKKIILNA